MPHTQLAGHSSRIAKQLEADGILNWNGKAKWYEVSIRGMLQNEKYKGDALLQKTYTVDFLTKKRVQNNGELQQFYIEDSHPAIIEHDTWEAVQLEVERRKNFCTEHNIKKIEFSTNDNPFAGRVICGNCGGLFGRKVWNSNNEKLRRIIWQCNGKYIEKGVIGCDNKHLDDKVFYDAFVEVYNIIVENKVDHVGKWNKLLDSEDLLKKITAKRFISVFENAVPLTCFDVDLYFMLVEKITVFDGSRLVVGLLDGMEVEVGF